MNRTLQFGVLVLISLLASNVLAQGTNRTHRRPDNTAGEAWSLNAYVDGYYVPGEQGYVDPIFTADHRWLHVEGRYNYEDLRTGSVWLGYNFNLNRDKKLAITLTPMVGGVFGRTNGVAPGCEASVTYEKFNFWVSNEYVFDAGNRTNNFFYTWPQVTYSPIDWLHVGLVAQRTQAIQSDTQAGFLLGLSHQKMEFTSYILDPGSKPTVVLELGYSF